MTVVMMIYSTAKNVMVLMVKEEPLMHNVPSVLIIINVLNVKTIILSTPLNLEQINAKIVILNVNGVMQKMTA